MRITLRIGFRDRATMKNAPELARPSCSDVVHFRKPETRAKESTNTDAASVGARVGDGQYFLPSHWIPLLELHNVSIN